METVTRYEVNSEKDAGWAEYRIDTIHPTVRGIGVQPTGRIIVAANGKVVALQPDGTVDPSFLPHKIYDLLNFQLYGDGRILLRNGIAPYQLTRLLPTGVLDQDFGINGSIWEPEGNEGEKLEQAIEPSGNLILGLKLC